MQVRRGLAAAVAVALLVFAGDGALAQATRIIKIIVPYPAGGPGDILARLLGEQIGQDHGLTVVVENRPGASGRIGTEAVARLPPDGNSLLIVANNLLIDPHVRKVNYDPFASFEPVCSLPTKPTSSLSTAHPLTAGLPICLMRRAPCPAN